MYSSEDVHLLALAVQLTRDGFVLKTVPRVLKELKGRSDLLGSHYSALVIRSSKAGPEIKLPEIKFLSGPLSIGVHEQLRADVIGRYVLNLRKMVGWVENRIEGMRRALGKNPLESKH